MSDYILYLNGNLDNRTNDELLHDALTNTDENIAWLAISELQH